MSSFLSRPGSTRHFRALLLFLCASCANAAITITTTLPGYYSQNNTIQGIAFQATGAASGIYSWSISAGSLPPGLTFTSGGVFSGTPTAAGTYSFTVKAADPQNPANTPGTRSFTIGIPQITTAPALPPATVGVKYSVQLQVTDGPATGAFWSLSLGGLPTGLTLDSATGIYSGTPTRTGNNLNPIITVKFNDPSGAFAVKQFSLTINAASQTLQVSPSALNFTSGGSNLPGAQNLAVSSTAAAAVAFSALVDDGQGGPAPAWLSVNPKAGTTPGLLRASIVPPIPAAGVYNARIRVSMSAAGTALPPVDVPVTFTVSSSPPTVTPSPAVLTFRELSASPGSYNQAFLLRNTGGGGDVPFSLSIVGNSPWISAVAASDQAIRAGSAVSVAVTINSQGLNPGTYRDAIRVTTSLAPPYNLVDIPVKAVIVDQGPVLSLNLTGVRFDATQDNPGSAAQSILVSDSGTPGTTVNWTAQAVQGQSLVTLTTPQGTSTPGSPAGFGISLSGTAASSPGGKYALIQVTDPQSQGSPQFVVVLANVAAAGTAPAPSPNPSGLLFQASAGGSAPAAQPVTLNTTSASPVAFSVSASTSDGASWLSVQPGSGNTSQSSPAQVSVSVAPGALKPGVYRGTVNFAIGALLRGVDVTLLVGAPGTINAGAAPRAIERAASCSPAAVVLAQTGLIENFSVPAGWPATLAVQLIDDCGNPLTNASVVASFSNGDAPLSLIGDGRTTSYTASWQPATALSGMTVTFDANAGTLTPAEVQISGDVNPNTTPGPSLASGGLLNNLNPLLGAPLAPGTVTQVYGDNLATSPGQPTAIPLPTTLQNVQALIGGLAAPLFYVSKTQLVIQLPTELAPKKTYSALLSVNGQFSLPQDVNVVPVTPGTVAFSDGTLVAQRGDGSLVDSGHPAKPSEPLTIYLVGMGVTTVPVASGNPAPSDPLPKLASDVEVTVDGQPATLIYAGLTPGGIGLYQINFLVPDTARTGGLDVVITQDGVPANPTKLIVAR